jgi:type II secretion system protein G
MLNRKGFTLIELLIVVVIIGILAAIAIPKFASTKEKAYLATMKSDLRNLITAQESYFADNNQYTTALPVTMYTVSTGDAGPTITVTGSNYTGWVSNANTARTCAIFIGTTALAPATKEGEPKCT